MLIRIGYELVFEVPQPTAMLLMLYLHPERAAMLRSAERIDVAPATSVEDFVDGFGNRAARIVAPAGTVRLRYDNAAVDSGPSSLMRARMASATAPSRCRMPAP